MQLRRFQAATISEAYERVREELGQDALIVSTRSATRPSVFGSDSSLVEVVAGLPDGEAASDDARVPLEQDSAAHDLARTVAEASAVGASPAAGEAAGIDPSRAEPDAEPDAEPAAGGRRRGPFDLWSRSSGADESDSQPELAPLQPVPDGNARVLNDMSRQLVELRAIVERIAAERVNDRVDAGPPALRQARQRLTDQGVTPSVLVPLLDEVANAIVPGIAPEQVLQTVQRRLAGRLPPVATLDLSRRPLAIFALGPGGAGKTSFAVRLALELGRRRGVRVALAGFDISRAGAPQQLAACGAATGLPVSLCYAPGELASLLNDGSADVVIVDTPGHNGTRRDRATELRAYLRAAPNRASLLVLPATAKTDDILSITSAFTADAIDGLVLTHCDETASFGALYSASAISGLGVAYTTHGEGIAEPLRTGDHSALSTALLVGQWPPAPAAVRAETRAG